MRLTSPRPAASAAEGKTRQQAFRAKGLSAVVGAIRFGVLRPPIRPSQHARAGNITIANAPGTGIADDKAIYSYMPEIVEFYTGRKAILQNVPTWRCSEPESLAYVLDNIADLVVKEVHGSGGYGMLVGPAADKETIETFRAKLKAKQKQAA